MAAVAQKTSPYVEITDLPEGQWIQFVTFSQQPVSDFPSPFKVLKRDRKFEFVDPGRCWLMDVQEKAHDCMPRNPDFALLHFSSLWGCQAKVLSQEEAQKLLGKETFEKLEKTAEKISKQPKLYT